jgi:small conductance mechanosensitive channel
MELTTILADKTQLEHWVQVGLAFGVNVLLALGIMIVGWVAARFLRRATSKGLRRSYVEPTLASFLGNIVYALVLAFAVVATLNKVGVQTTSLVALIGAAGLAIGLALQGSLSNFAAGIMIIIFRHFRVGDVIETGVINGTVESLDIFNTVIITADNQKVIVPNSKLTQDAVINFSARSTRRISINLQVAQEADVMAALRVLREAIAAQPGVLHEQEVIVGIQRLLPGATEIALRCWCESARYLEVYYALMERIKTALDGQHIALPPTRPDAAKP